VLAFIVAGIGCAFAGLCYAEFASMIPVAGSAYTYSYATMGELVAWIIGWDLILEYAVAAATVSDAWSEYANRVLSWFHMAIPYQWTHSPFEHDPGGTYGIMNVPALFILLILTMLLIKGTKESAFVNGLIVILKVSIVLLFIGIGWQFINPANHTPFIPPASTHTTAQGIVHHYGGLLGILGAAGVVFFAYIGFDAVSTAAQEAKNPKRDMPMGILGSLVICTILYIIVSGLLTRLVPYSELNVPDPVVVGIRTTGQQWATFLVELGAVAGLATVMLVMLLGQSRVFYSMSRDGLLWPWASKIHPKFRTPYISSIVVGVFVAILAMLVPLNVLDEMTSVGTLLAFVLVSIGVWVMRRTHPEMHRPFRTPLVPLVPILSVLFSGLLIVSLSYLTQLRLLIWLIIGFGIYFTYSVKHSKVRNPQLPR
jgi:basic amino acid/polyamine antiporter, APA family